MGLLERRRMLLEAAGGDDLDGKYVAFVQAVSTSPYNGGVYLSSDYGQSFEKIADINWTLNYQSHIKPAIDVDGGKPVVYFPSGSAGKMSIYKWKDGNVSLFVTSSNSVYAKASLYCLDRDVVLWVNCGTDRLYIASGSNLTEWGQIHNSTYMCLNSPKGRRKKGYLTFASYPSSNNTPDIFWTKGYTTPASFTLYTASVSASLPASSSRPSSISPYGDIDISTDGQTIGVVYNGNIGLAFGEGLQGNSYWHYSPRLDIVRGNYAFCSGFTFSKDKSFVAFRSSSNSSNFTNYVSRYSTLIPSTSSVELTSTLPAPTTGQNTQYGYYSMSLWSNTKGDKLMFKGTSYAGADTPICYSHDAGVTWNKSSYPSGSSTCVVGVDVYRI